MDCARAGEALCALFGVLSAAATHDSTSTSGGYGCGCRCARAASFGAFDARAALQKLSDDQTLLLLTGPASRNSSDDGKWALVNQLIADASAAAAVAVAGAAGVGAKKRPKNDPIPLRVSAPLVRLGRVEVLVRLEHLHARTAK